MAVTLIPHTTCDWVDETQTSDPSGTLVVTCDEGYKFDGDITLHSNKTGKDYKPNSVSDTEVRFYRNYINRDWIVQGKVISAGGTPPSEIDIDVTNNIPNTTYEITGSSGTYDITITPESGFVFDGEIKVIYYDSFGGENSEVATVTGKVATAHISGASTFDGLELTGNTKEGTPAPEIDVTNNVKGTTETHDYDGETLTITLQGGDTGNAFFDLSASYTDTAGTPQETKDFQISDKTATVVITDIDGTQPVTINGTYTKAIPIEDNLFNCTSTEPLPTAAKEGDTVNVTLKANEGYTFTGAQDPPVLRHPDKTGQDIDHSFTISQDGTTATLNYTFPTGYVIPYAQFRGGAQIKEVISSNYGAINVYLVTDDDLAAFAAKRFFTTSGTFIELETDLGYYVNRIKRIFADIPKGAQDRMKLGNFDTGITVYTPASDKLTLDFGTAKVPDHNKNTTDYESTVQVFLPFYGFVDVPSDYVGYEIGLVYEINVITGGGVAKLTYNGVPFSITDVQPCSDVLYRTSDADLSLIGGTEWNEQILYGLEPYIYCKWYESATGGRNNDRQTGEIGDFRGFNVFDDVTPIHTAEMLTEEQEMIYAALSDGVYIE